MSATNRFVKQSDAIPSSSTFTSPKFNASDYRTALIDVHVTARTSGSIKAQVYRSVSEDGDYTLVKETSAISAVGHTTLTLNSFQVAVEILGWIRIVMETATGVGVGFSAEVDAVFS